MEIVDISLDKLRAAEWNPNSMDGAMTARLSKSIGRHGLVVPLVVRPAGDKYEVLSGNQRLGVLREVNTASVPCVVVDVDDAHARLLAQALNRVRGEDNLAVKAELVREVLESLDVEDVLALLPETQEGLEELALLGEESLEEHLQEWQMAQGAKLKHFSVQLTEDQLAVVEEVMGRFLAEAKALKEDNPNLRGNSLYFLCRGYLEGMAGHGGQA